MKIWMGEQGGPDWFAVKRGIPSASNFNRILTPEGKPSGQAHGYICELIGDMKSEFLPERIESYTSRPMAWGIECEAEARRLFSLDTNLDVTQVGFLIHESGHYGASPDGMIRHGEGEYQGTLEMKCPLPKTQVEYLLGGEMPPDYLPQVHGQLIVTGLPEARFFSYCPGLPPFHQTVKPDSYTDDLRRALDDFHGMLQEALAKLGMADDSSAAEWRKEKEKRIKLLEAIQRILVSRWPKKSGKDKDAKLDTIEQAFCTREWKKIEGMDSGRLIAGLESMKNKIGTDKRVEEQMEIVKAWLGIGPSRESIKNFYSGELPLMAEQTQAEVKPLVDKHCMLNGWSFNGKEVVDAN